MLTTILTSIITTILTLLAIHVAKNIYISWMLKHRGREIGASIVDEIVESFKAGMADAGDEG